MLKSKPKILCSRISGETTRKIRDSILELTGKHFWVVKNADRIKRKGILFRFGNSGDSIYETGNEINSKEFIRTCSNKYRFSQFCKERGIETPQFYKYPDKKPEKYPIIVRKTLTGFGGKGIQIINNEKELEDMWDYSYWWTPMYNFISEYRAHVLGGEIVRIFKKERNEGLEEEKYPIRNFHLGYHFSNRDIEKFPKAKELINKIDPEFQKIGGHFYGIDIGYIKDGEEGKYIVIENNTSPGLNPNVAKIYAEYLIKKLNIK